MATRLDDAFQKHIEDMQKHSPIIKDVGRVKQRGPLRVLRDWQDRLQTWLDQAAMGLGCVQFLCLSLCLAILMAILLWWFLDDWWLVAIGSVGALFLPGLIVYSRRNARADQITAQLPDAFSAMGRGLRAGQSVPSVVQMIANDFPRPLSEEFSYFFEQQHLGVPQEEALRDMARRVNVMELRIFTVALIVHRKSGGNLAELLQKLSALVRKRVKMKRRIKSLTGEGRMQATVLIGMPAIVVLIMLITAPQYVGVILDRRDILAGCAVSQMFGAFCIYRIVNFDY